MYYSQRLKVLPLTSFATFGFVLKLLIMKEPLFIRRENKVLTTVDTLEHFVTEFHWSPAPFNRSPTRKLERLLAEHEDADRIDRPRKTFDFREH